MDKKILDMVKKYCPKDVRFFYQFILRKNYIELSIFEVPLAVCEAYDKTKNGGSVNNELLRIAKDKGYSVDALKDMYDRGFDDILKKITFAEIILLHNWGKSEFKEKFFSRNRKRKVTEYVNTHREIKIRKNEWVSGDKETYEEDRYSESTVQKAMDNLFGITKVSNIESMNAKRGRIWEDNFESVIVNDIEVTKDRVKFSIVMRNSSEEVNLAKESFLKCFIKAIHTKIKAEYGDDKTIVIYVEEKKKKGKSRDDIMVLDVFKYLTWIYKNWYWTDKTEIVDI